MRKFGTPLLATPEVGSLSIHTFAERGQRRLVDAVISMIKGEAIYCRASVSLSAALRPSAFGKRARGLYANTSPTAPWFAVCDPHIVFTSCLGSAPNASCVTPYYSAKPSRAAFVTSGLNYTG